MGSIISIGTTSNGNICSRQVPPDELLAIMSASIELLDRLGETAKYVEIIKVKPWYGSGLNIFDVKVVISVLGEEFKAEAEGTIEERIEKFRQKGQWDPERLVAKIVEIMESKIYNAIRDRITGLGIRIETWERLLPK